MKKLTGLLMSLMLFLGMGTAFAVTPPTFTPGNGDKAAPGQVITINVADQYKTTDMQVLYWTFNGDYSSALGSLDFSSNTIESITGGQYAGMGLYGAVCMGKQTGIDADNVMIWAPEVKIPDNAQGQTIMYYRYAVPSGDSYEATEVEYVVYTVEGEAAGLPEPVFSPEEGAVEEGTEITISGTPAGTYLMSYNIAYAIDDENFDFSQYIGKSSVPSDHRYSTNMPRTVIKVNEPMKITAAIYEFNEDDREIIRFSKPVTASYTIASEQVLPAPVFNPDGGEILDGTPILLTNGTESDETPLPIYYNQKTAAALTAIKTKTELDKENGKLLTQSAAKLYTSAGITIKADRTFNAATAKIDADGNVTWSEVTTQSFTYTKPAPVKPEAPAFNPDGGEVEAEEEITITSSCGSCKIYYARGTNPDFVNYETEDELDEAESDMMASFSSYSNSNKPTLGNYGVETPGAKLSISAAVASIDASGTILWSDVTTKEFTVKADDGPVAEVADPVITPATDATVHMGDMVTITCETEDAEIWYTANGKVPYTEDNKGNINGISSDAIRYMEPFALTEDMLIDQGTTYALKIRAVTKKGDAYASAGVGLNAYPNTPQFSPVAGVVEQGTKVTITCVPSQAVIYYTLDGTMPSEEESTLYTEPIEITEAMTLRAVAVLGQYQTSASAVYKIEGETEAVTLTFNPVSGSEVEENTAVTITASDADVDIFYMMFESQEAAEAAAWDQEAAMSYSDEMKPVVSTEKPAIKAAYAYVGAEAVAEDFFYATYTVKAQPAIDLIFNPASGAEVEDGTEITVTATRETEILYNLYADKAAADADEAFVLNAKDVKEDGMPVITKGNTFLRCAVYDNGIQYFDATYTIKDVANEDEELAGVTVYPNPSNGVFSLNLPVAASVEVFAINGTLMQHFNAKAGTVTLNINRSGIYFLRITGEGRTAIKRIIVR